MTKRRVVLTVFAGTTLALNGLMLNAQPPEDPGTGGGGCTQTKCANPSTCVYSAAQSCELEVDPVPRCTVSICT
jgi:hypothetical protein